MSLCNCRTASESVSLCHKLPSLVKIKLWLLSSFWNKSAFSIFWWPALKDRCSCQQELVWSYPKEERKPGRERQKQRQIARWNERRQWLRACQRALWWWGGKKENLNLTSRTVALLFSWSLFWPNVVCMLMWRGVNVWTSAPYISICYNKG